MKAYLLTIAGVIILSAVVSILVSDGKMGKFIKGMMRLFVFSVVIVPFISMFGEKDFVFSTAEIESDEGYLIRCSEILEEKDEKEIIEFLSREYGIIGEAEVVRDNSDGFARKKINVKIFDAGIFGQDEHIDIIGRIKIVLEEKYGCQTEVAWRVTE